MDNNHSIVFCDYLYSIQKPRGPHLSIVAYQHRASPEENYRLIAHQRRHYPKYEPHQGVLYFWLSVRPDEGFRHFLKNVHNHPYSVAGNDKRQ
jgi:hypothetical protein